MDLEEKNVTSTQDGAKEAGTEKAEARRGGDTVEYPIVLASAVKKALEPPADFIKPAEPEPAQPAPAEIVEPKKEKDLDLNKMFFDLSFEDRATIMRAVRDGGAIMYPKFLAKEKYDEWDKTVKQGWSGARPRGDRAFWNHFLDDYKNLGEMKVGVTQRIAELQAKHKGKLQPLKAKGAEIENKRNAETEADAYELTVLQEELAQTEKEFNGLPKDENGWPQELESQLVTRPKEVSSGEMAAKIDALSAQLANLNEAKKKEAPIGAEELASAEKTPSDDADKNEISDKDKTPVAKSEPTAPEPNKVAAGPDAAPVAAEKSESAAVLPENKPESKSEPPENKKAEPVESRADPILQPIFSAIDQGLPNTITSKNGEFLTPLNVVTTIREWVEKNPKQARAYLKKVIGEERASAKKGNPKNLGAEVFLQRVRAELNKLRPAPPNQPQK